MAGNQAGFAYNTFPLMEGRLVTSVVRKLREAKAAGAVTAVITSRSASPTMLSECIGRRMGVAVDYVLTLNHERCWTRISNAVRSLVESAPVLAQAAKEARSLCAQRFCTRAIRIISKGLVLSEAQSLKRCYRPEALP